MRKRYTRKRVLIDGFATPVEQTFINGRPARSRTTRRSRRSARDGTVETTVVLGVGSSRSASTRSMGSYSTSVHSVDGGPDFERHSFGPHARPRHTARPWHPSRRTLGIAMGNRRQMSARQLRHLGEVPRQRRHTVELNQRARLIHTSQSPEAPFFTSFQRASQTSSDRIPAVRIVRRSSR